MKLLRALGKAGLAAGTMALVLGLHSVASAATYVPGGTGSGVTDLNDLDHYYMYTWYIQDGTSNGSAFAGIGTTTEVKSAVLTFTNMSNWAREANSLYITLLDSALQTGVLGGDTSLPDRNFVTSARDISSGDSTTYNNLSNGFTDGTALDKGLINSATASSAVFLTAQAFPYGTDNISKTTGLSSAYGSSAGATLGDGWDKLSSDTSAPFTYTYTFTEQQLGVLTNFLANGYDFALGFDPDCHFDNAGISLSLTTGAITAAPAVPEPASIILLGTGLLAAGRRYRKSRR